jgi:serine/threonine-protein kinase RsbW
VDRLAPEVAPWASVRLVGMSEPLAEVGQPPVELADAVARVVAGGVLPADSPYTVLPLAVRGAVRGTLALGVPVGEADPVFLVELADRAALALENARLYEQEREIASTLQRGLLAGDPPADERFRVETYYRAGTRGLQVGGDWYDAFLITTDKLAVVVGDVVGRGLHAASTMGQLRSAIRALAAAEAGPARLVEQLDRFVGQVDSARMATLAYAEITLSTREMVYCCAGHLPPVLMGPDGEPELLWGGRSAPLGARAGRTARSEDRLRLVDGTRLLLYTDGLIERRDRSLDAGFTALAAEFEACREAPLRGLAARLAHALAGTAQPDDVCLLCVSVGAEPRLERAIPADAHQIAPLRRDLRGWLIANAIDEDSRNAVVLACSEAVANAIEHGYRGDGRGVIVVRASLVDAGVEVRVRDEGSWRSGAGDPARGRGLLLIRQVMDEVQVEREHGTTVTMRRRTRGGAAA